MGRRHAIALILLVAVLGAGCASHRIETDPPGAIVEYSPTGIDPWMPVTGDAASSMTPLSFTPSWNGYAFVRARRPDFVPTERTLVDAGRPSMWRRIFASEELSYTLRPTAERELAQRLDDQDAGTTTTLAAATIDDATTSSVVMPLELLPEDAATIDKQLADLKAHPDTLTEGNGRFEETGLMPEGTSRLRLINATSLDAEFLIGGPEPQTVSLEPFRETAIELPPGHRQVAALPTVSGPFQTFFVDADLEQARSYTLLYFGNASQERHLDEILETVNALRTQTPTIAIPEVELPAPSEEELPSSGSGRRPPGAGGGRRGGGPPRRGGR